MRVLLIGSIFLYPLLFIWQGLDFTDMGFMLTNFQQIFNDPASIESSFRIWLTNIIGGIWVYFFGDSLGVFGYRVAGVLLAWLTLLVVYVILKPYFTEKLLLLGLLLALIFTNRFGFGLNYNTLTGFFYVLAAYFLHKGVLSRKLSLIFFSGLVIGANIFVRLPNISGLTFILVLLYNERLQRNGYRALKEKLGVFLLGFLAAISISVIVMYFLGHLESYFLAFKGTFSMLGDEKSHHSGVKLNTIFLEHNRRVLIMLGITTLSIFVLGVIIKSVKKITKSRVEIIIIPLFIIGLILFYYEELQVWFKILVAVLGIIYLFLVLNLSGYSLNYLNFKYKAIKENEFKVLSFIALLVLFLTPLGSNLGINNSLYGMYLGLPIAIGTFFSIKEFSFPWGGVTKKELHILRVFLVLVLIGVMLKATYFFTYRETKYREELIYQVRHEKLRGVYTTKERAHVVQELVDALSNYAREDDYLLAYEQIPMIYFLTKTRPYLYGSWPMLYAPERFANMLKKAQSEKNELPVIVRAKGSTEHSLWPRTKKLSLEPKFVEIRAIMTVFIAKNDYKLAWENSFFEIFTPSGGDESD